MFRSSSSDIFNLSATARWVLPTPGGPRRRTFSPLSMYRPVASSRMTLGSMEGWNLKSKLSSVFWKGNRAMAIHMARWVLPLRADFAGEEFVHEVRVGELPFGRLLQERRELRLDLVESQAVAVGPEPVELGGAHRPPPALGQGRVEGQIPDGDLTERPIGGVPLRRRGRPPGSARSEQPGVVGRIHDHGVAGSLGMLGDALAAMEDLVVRCRLVHHDGGADVAHRDRVACRRDGHQGIRRDLLDPDALVPVRANGRERAKLFRNAAKRVLWPDNNNDRKLRHSIG